MLLPRGIEGILVQLTQATSRNRLISALSQDDYALVRPNLEFVGLALRQVLEASNEPIEHVYFFEHGLGSVVAIGSRDIRIEVGVIGWEGMSGVAVVLGNTQTPNETFVQIAGDGLRLRSDDLRVAMRTSATLTSLLLKFAQSLMIQASHTALANGQAKINQRLARWLLMAHDRADGDDLALKHEFLALMLGVRREGVTIAIHQLEDAGLIRPGRGLIVVRDRGGLEECAGGIYGVPEAELDRLLN